MKNTFRDYKHGGKVGSNIHLIRASEGEQEYGRHKDKMAETFSGLMKDRITKLLADISIELRTT